MVTAAALDVRAVVAAVVDPEIPVLTIDDLGILRSVEEDSGRVVVVTITPTYSGCPAMRQIEDDIETALQSHGIDEFEITVSHSPPWSTDWLTDAGREKLSAFGIAPPVAAGDVVYPRCESTRPRMIARFGSTASSSFAASSMPPRISPRSTR